MKEKMTGVVVGANIDEKNEGLYLTVRTESGRDVVCHSSINEDWLRIPVGKDPRKELEITCNLLNGYKTDSNGNKTVISGHRKIAVTIIKEDVK